MARHCNRFRPILFSISKESKMRSCIIAKILLLSVKTLVALHGVAQTESITCPIHRKIGTKNLCLPNISGMTECLMETNVIDYIDSRTMKENHNIALYIDNSNKSGISDLEHEILDNYLIVYTSKSLENEYVDETLIQEMDSQIASSYNVYLDSTWEIVQQRMREKLPSMEFDQPVKIDHYMVDKNVPCIITIGRALENEIERIFLTATVYRVVNEKFLVSAWYLRYTGVQSIDLIKSKIDYFSRLVGQINPKKSKDVNIELLPTNTNLAEAATYFNSALEQSNKGNFNEAIHLYSQAIERYPTSEKVRLSEAYLEIPSKLTI